ncbi:MULTISPECIES: 23S rRNA (uracil(1939)-C(5))-methyltransferase RlmD [Gammaproteobacteria]|uniref:23S rRNA (uracil(1939)-C(5))-methyltransferase RlmD n=1 Tax=Gammaproteobacteria TaxID=1236 RepID=UPI000DD01A6C|nr:MULTISPECIES: 23S rRNA (uracil(1939)-C(5))-methyltransferase RlmD [Gammaproteobacteria]RTE87699.1 23S rRNA (uracil(1939)-C(5))-methyltransferase RlmD [Aliidiomarina sp. B3213]TCZ92518.1 23S rRNA (uracil(1939)-C(5))-methyltransferase RlmD [Lysobacter sp. N42]
MPSLFDRRRGFKPKNPRSARISQAQKTEPTSNIFSARIEKLSHDGRGVTHHDNGKVVFVEYALPGEVVKARITQSHDRFSEAVIKTVEHASEERQTPPCPYFGECGGCQLQHLSYQKQVKFKQQQVEELIHKNLKDIELPWQQPVAHERYQYGYRRRIRLAIAPRERSAGFRAHQSKAIIKIEQCNVAEKPISDLLKPLQSFLSDYPSIKYLGHIELLLDETNGDRVVALVRVTKPLTEAQHDAWLKFQQQHNLRVIIQDNPVDKPERFSELNDDNGQLPVFGYRVANDTLYYGPNEFIQINRHINARMLETVTNWLALEGHERILELFAGFGNFSAQLGRASHSVLAVEGAKAQVERGTANMKALGINNVQFQEADLSELSTAQRLLGEQFDVLVLDPPRAGAEEVCKQKIAADKILYVSCSPVSLARDLSLLLQQNFTIEKISILDMFAQTSHAETVVLLKKSGNKP